MNPILFYIFGAIAAFSAIAMLFFRNPVSAAISLVLSFCGLAALFVGLDAHFIGVIQILVYTGAVMVLFLFIIMLLNVKKEETKRLPFMPLLASLALVVLLLGQFVGIIGDSTPKQAPEINLEQAAIAYKETPKLSQELEKGNYPNASIIGVNLFGKHNAAFLIAGLVLVVATIGVVSLSRRPESR